MKFIYTEHAKLRISQRRISRKQIENTLTHLGKRLPSYKGRLIARKNFGGKILEVIYKKLNSDTVIITAYWLKEVR